VSPTFEEFGDYAPEYSDGYMQQQQQQGQIGDSPDRSSPTGERQQGDAGTVSAPSPPPEGAMMHGQYAAHGGFAPQLQQPQAAQMYGQPAERGSYWPAQG